MKRILLTAIFSVLAYCFLMIASSAATEITDDGSLLLGAPTIEGVDTSGVSATVGLKYSFDEATKTAKVISRGNYAGGADTVIAIPSTVTYNGVQYTVTEIAARVFNGLTCNEIYVPDTVTRIAGGSQNGCFGNMKVYAVYIGKGISAIERETFSGTQGIGIFVCKSKVTEIGAYAFNQVNSTSDTQVVEYELDLSNVITINDNAFAGCHLIQSINLGSCIRYIGSNAFINAQKMKGTVIIPEDCEIKTSCFNNCHSLSAVIVRVKEGTVRTIPQEFLSAAGKSGFIFVIDGPAVVANATTAFPGVNNQKLYMPTKEMLQTFLDSYVAANSYIGRIKCFTYYTCDGVVYTCDEKGVLTAVDTEFSHFYAPMVYVEADCTHFARNAEICYCCEDEKISWQGDEYGDHDFETSTKLPTCRSKGYTEYDCTICSLQYVSDWVNETEHQIEPDAYTLNGNMITISYKCSNCGFDVKTETVSLVNKTYIEGYGLFDATLEYVNVSANGVATPSNVAFNEAVIYFPSYVEINGEIVEVKTVQGFKGKSLKAIYVPDTVTSMPYVGGGAFGDIGTLTNVVVGKGVTEIDRETFSMGNGATFEEFVLKGTITKIGTYALQKVNAASEMKGYEFNTALTYVGQYVNLRGNILKEVYIKYSCDLSEKFAFNGAVGLKTCYIEGGSTAETAKILTQEMFSGDAVYPSIVINGYAIPGGNHISPTRGANFFFATQDAMIEFIKAAGKGNFQGNERFGVSAFYCCADTIRWRINKENISADATINSFYHDSYEMYHVAKDRKCYACGENMSNDIVDPVEHKYDGGVITVAPNCNSLGKIVYTCLICGETKEYSIFRDYTTHIYLETVDYSQGFDNQGKYLCQCTICSEIKSEATLDAIFKALGYSVRQDGKALHGGFTIDTDALKFYNEWAVSNGKTVLEFGIIMSNSGTVTVVDGKYTGGKGVMVCAGNNLYSRIGYTISGYSATKALVDLDLVIALYVDDGEKMSLIQWDATATDTVDASINGEKITVNSIDLATVASATLDAIENNEENALFIEKLEEIVNVAKVVATVSSDDE